MNPQKILGKDLLIWRQDQLAKGGRPVDLDWLLDIKGGIDWSSLKSIYIDDDKSFLLKYSLSEISKLWSRHLDTSEPLQYIVQRCPWRDFELEVGPSVLIPRQETEILIDLALDKVPFDDNNFSKWADLGTGSGAMAIALAKALPNWEGHAVDISKEALILAEKNFQKISPNSNYYLHQGNWWKPLKQFWGEFSLAVVNPPYIPSQDIKNLDNTVKDHEPYLALEGGVDGLKHFRAILIDAHKALSSGGILVMEHHHDQSNYVINLMKEFGLSDVEFAYDLEGVKRFAIGCRP